MLQFCGQERCLVDANGRVKLSTRFLDDFRHIGGAVVLHCLPEGVLAVYAAAVWAQMRQADPRPAVKAARSVLFRRQLRRFGAMTQSDSISNQGRITIPVPFRESLELEPGTEAVLVGCEIGVEIWNASRWRAEFELLARHEQRKAEAEMSADLGSDLLSAQTHAPPRADA